MSAEVQGYEQPRSHFEITQSPLELSGFLVDDSGYEIGYRVELAKGPQGFVKSRIFFFIYFSILGIKKIVRYIDDFFI